jgi:hypothetical protein
MKHCLITLVLLAASTLVGVPSGIIGFSVAGGAIAQNEAGPNTATNPGGVPIPTPTDLWGQIEILRNTDSIMAQTHPFHMGQSHSFQLGSRTVDWYTTDFANKQANDEINKAGAIAKVTKYPPNSLVVKVNYTKDRKLTGITAMLKVTGYDPADRDWVMAAYSPSGKNISYGKVAACIGCHNFVRSADFVFAPPPDQLLPVSTWKAFFPKDTMSEAYLELLKTHPDAIVK